MNELEKHLAILNEISTAVETMENFFVEVDLDLLEKELKVLKLKKK